MIRTLREGPYGVIIWRMQPINVLGGESLTAFEEALEGFLQDPTCQGLVITSENREFIAGADLRTIEALMQAGDPRAVYEGSWALQKLFLRLETGGKPVVAAMPGTALGGGYELALACHYRILVNEEGAEVGLPETQLGLMPGGGGTQRLPRKIGILSALPLILEGRRLSSQEAKAQGLVEELIESRDQLLERALRYLATKPTSQNPWHDPKFRMPGGEIYSPAVAPYFAAAIAKLREKSYGLYPNLTYCMSAIYEGLQVPFVKGLEIESRYFAKTIMEPSARAMVRTLFFEKQRLERLPHRPEGIPPAVIKKVAVLGAGMMGKAIAYVCARAGLETYVKDASPTLTQGARTFAEKALERELQRGRLSQASAQAILNRLHLAQSYEELAGADLVIEAVIEDRQVKTQVYQDIFPLLHEKSVVASNTSTLPITSLAEAIPAPERFIGLHFFSPAERMPLLEIILGQKTSPKTLAWSLDFAAKIRKTPIVVRDSRGFFTSRVFGTYVREGLRMLLEGVPPALIENLGRMAGMPVGPLALADEVSIALMYQILRQTEADLGHSLADDPVHPIGKCFVEELGRLGRKAGKGFYEYPPDAPKYLWPGLKELFPPKPVNPAQHEVLKDRFLYVQVAEALRTYQEGILLAKEDGDVSSILGWGFAPYTGGVFHFIEFVGKERFLARSEHLAREYGDRFAVSL